MSGNEQHEAGADAAGLISMDDFMKDLPELEGPKTRAEAIEWLQRGRCWNVDHETEVEVRINRTAPRLQLINRYVAGAGGDDERYGT